MQDNTHIVFFEHQVQYAHKILDEQNFPRQWVVVEVQEEIFDRRDSPTGS